MRAFIQSFDLAVTKVIVALPMWLRPLFLGVTTLGDPMVTVPIGLVIAIYGYTQANIRLVLAGASVWLTLGIGALLKLIISRERPLTDYAANLQIPTFSFPSGHSSGSVIAYGLLAYMAWYLLPHPWNYIVVAALVGLIVLIGVSRIYLGAHFPSDVVAGWLLGTVMLCIVIFILKPLA